MNAWIWIPITFVFLLWLVWFCSEVKADRVEVKEVKDGFVPEAEIGTFRIRPHVDDLSIRVERYVEADYFVDGKQAHPRWVEWDSSGFRRVWANYNGKRTYSPAKFQTEREAEVFIKMILEREEKARIEAEEKFQRQKTFAEEHPARTIPPYKYIS